jgi:hypothetical protein
MTQPTQDQIRAWLVEARQARHALMTGQGVVSMAQGGRSLTFNQASISRLDAYIAELEALLCGGRGPSRLFTMTQWSSGYGNGC